MTTQLWPICWAKSLSRDSNRAHNAMWPLYGGTLGTWKSSYPDSTTYLNPKGISSSVATYNVGSDPPVDCRSADVLNCRSGAAPSAVRFITGAAPPPVTSVPGVAYRDPLLSGPALGPGVTTLAITMPPRVV